MPSSTCSMADCTSQARFRGWCEKHYRRWRRTGDPQGWHTRLSMTEALQQRRKIEGDCWLWAGHRDDDGYGVIWTPQGNRKVHVVAYCLATTGVVRSLAPMDVDHLCRRRACFRVEHLELVPHRENCRRAAQARKLQAT